MFSSDPCFQVPKPSDSFSKSVMSRLYNPDLIENGEGEYFSISGTAHDEIQAWSAQNLEGKNFVCPVQVLSVPWILGRTYHRLRLVFERHETLFR